MSCRRCGLSTAEALKRIFLTFTETPSRNGRLAAFTVQRNQRRHAGFVTRRTGPSQSNAPSTLTPRTFGPAGFTRQPRDLDLPAIVRIVDATGNLSRPQIRKRALDSMNRKQFFLVQVSEGENGEPPICKMVKKEVVFEQDRERFAPKKQDTTQSKAIEMGWKLADADLNHKIEMLRAFLEAGKKVDVILVARKKRNMVEPEEAQPFLKKVRQHIMETIAEFPGAREKEMTGTPGKMVTITIEPPSTPKGKMKSTTIKEKAPKQIRMNWMVLDTELEAKKGRIEELIAANALVDLEISAKVPKFEISEKAGQEVLTRIKRRLKLIPNCIEITPMDGTIGKSVTMHLGNEVQLGIEEENM